MKNKKRPNFKARPCGNEPNSTREESPGIIKVTRSSRRKFLGSGVALGATLGLSGNAMTQFFGGGDGKTNDPPGGSRLSDDSFDSLKLDDSDHNKVAHSGSVYEISFHPSGRFIASCSGSERVIKVWSIPAGRLVRQYHGHRKGVSSVEIDSSGRMMSSGDIGGTVALWGGRGVNAHPRGVEKVKFSPDSKTLASIGGDKVIFWPVPEMNNYKSLKLKELRAFDLSWSPDGEQVAVLAGKTVYLYDPVAQRQLGKTSTGEEFPFNVSFFPDSKSLLFATESTIFTYSNPALDLIGTFQPEGGRVTAVAISPTGTFFAYHCKHGLKLSSVADSTKILSISEEYQLPSVSCLRFSPDGKLLASGHSDGSIRIWHIHNRKLAAKPFDTALFQKLQRDDREFLAELDRRIDKSTGSPTDLLGEPGTGVDISGLETEGGGFGSSDSFSSSSMTTLVCTCNVVYF